MRLEFDSGAVHEIHMGWMNAPDGSRGADVLLVEEAPGKFEIYHKWEYVMCVDGNWEYEEDTIRARHWRHAGFLALALGKEFDR